MKSAIITSLALAATAAAAQMTGEFGRTMMTGGRGWSFWGILGGVFFVGLTLLVWLWALKLWKELRSKKR